LLTALAEVASAAHFQSIRRCKLPNALLANTTSVVYLPHTSTFDNKRETATKKKKGEEKIKLVSINWHNHTRHTCHHRFVLSVRFNVVE
jgi:hypothetical protein